jgi:Antibiotic biosynthesis monooxygenase
VIEIMRFRLPPGAAEEDLLAADRRVQEEFAYQQPGLLRRTTARGDDGSWIVIDLWRSAADADACDARWEHDPVPQAFMALLDRSSVSTERYQELD